MRFLYVALERTTGSKCPTQINGAVLDRACQLIAENYKEPYRFGLDFQIMYSTMIEYRLVSTPGSWTSFLPKEISNISRSGKEFDALRYKRLPSPLGIDAICYIFNNPKDNSDVAVTSICGLLLSNPDRIIEVLTAPLDCIAINQTIKSDKLKSHLYLRWFPAKDGNPMLKRVIESMGDTARRSISNLKKLGQSAREVALWYEINPTKIFLPSHLEHYRFKSFLTTDEVNLILFDGKKKKSSLYLLLHKIIPNFKSLSSDKEQSDAPFIPFALVQNFVISLIPAGFPILNPITGIKYSEALCISRHGELNSDAPYTCMFQSIDYDFIRTKLGRNAKIQSIFDKHGFSDENGGRLTLKTHMFRHYLTMAGIVAGLSDIELNKSAGRSNSSHLINYKSQSDRDVVALVRNAIASNKPEIAPLANMDARIFVNRSEFANIRVITAHTTEFGHCLHDYATLPCQLHGDHINCNEHVVIKGEVEQEKNLRCLQSETTLLLNKAKEAMTAEEYGANMWVKEHSSKLERINSIITLLADPNTPDGAVVQASGVVPPSRIKQAIEARLKISNAPLYGGTIRSIADVKNLLNNQVAKIEGGNE